MASFAPCLRALVAAVALAAASLAAARPFTTNDLLGAEEFGQVAITADGRWLIAERLAGQGRSGPFDQDVYTGYRRSRLYVADLRSARGAPRLRPVLPTRAGEGQVAGPMSPDNRRMAVLRFAGSRWELGVVEFATRRVRWLGMTPELGWLGQTLVWRSDHELLVATRPDGEAPLRLRTGAQWRQDLQRQWRRAAVGEPALTVIGSGRYRNVRPRAPPGRLRLVDLHSGCVRDLAQGDVFDLELSPDGRRVAAMADFEDLPPPTGAMRVAEAARRRNLLVVDLSSGEARAPCPDCQLATHLMAWSPDGSEVLVYGRRRAQGEGAGAYLRLGAAGTRAVPLGAASPVIDLTSEGYEIPRAGWLGRDPLILARGAGGRADWVRVTPTGTIVATAGLAPPAPRLVAAGPGAVVVLAGDMAYRLGSDAGPQPLFPAAGLAPPSLPGLSSRLRINAPLAHAWFAEPGSSFGGTVLRDLAGHVIRDAAPTGAPLVALPAPGGAAHVVRADNGTLQLSWRTAHGRARALMTLNRRFRHVAFARPQPIVTQTADGTRLTHWLFLPPGPPTARPPPLVVLAYPGATYPTAPAPYGHGVAAFPTNAQVLAGAGFAVLVPSLPRAAGAEPGEGLAAQVLAIADVAVAQAQLDPGRIAIMGQSFGGYAALMAATQSTRFAAVVAVDAPSDLLSVRGAFDPHAAVRPRDGLGLNANYGWSERGQGGLGVSPWEDPALYLRNSPLIGVARITAPVLLIHGDGDFVPLAQAQEMFSALNRLDKDAELVTVHGEGHIVSSPGNRRAVDALTIRWLWRTLR